MKNTKIAIATIAIVLLTGCTKEQITPSTESQMVGCWHLQKQGPDDVRSEHHILTFLENGKCIDTNGDVSPWVVSNDTVFMGPFYAEIQSVTDRDLVLMFLGVGYKYEKIN